MPDINEMMDLNCAACGGPLVGLGALGDLHWFRCRNCGMDQSINHHEDDAELHEGDCPEDVLAPPLYHVSKYEEQQLYGGPEEGGWWYDWTTYVATVGTFTKREDAQAFQDQLVKRDAPENAERKHRVNEGLARGANMDSIDDPEPLLRGECGDDKVLYIIETEPGSRERKEHPHYE